ncbi:MAG: hypothetical protein ABR569_12270 [Gaiellaceae bacterium]
MTQVVRELADAVLYEGHVLWPYRRSSIKNRQRWTFGGIYPDVYARSSSDRSVVQVECLVEDASPVLDVDVRFLHVVRRQAARGKGLEPVDQIAGYLTWDETTERTVELRAVRSGRARRAAIAVREGRAVETVEGGALIRSWQSLEGHVEARVEPLDRRLYRVRVRIANDSAWPGTDRDSAARRTLLSAHAVLFAREGDFISSVDPPEPLRAATAALRSEGLWPVLVGAEGERRTMLAAPIILSDYARVAPESPGDFFDGGEIDQLLVLNILGLTDDEKRELRAGDPRAREILERTEAMTPEAMAQLHGVIRELRPVEGP